MFEMFENDLNDFCDVFEAENIEELRPYWGGSIKSKISTNSLKFLAICTWRAINVIRGTIAFRNITDFDNFADDFDDLDNPLSYIFVNDEIKGIPFFDSGYQGIALRDIDGNKFFFMIQEGYVGFEDHCEAYATVGTPYNEKCDYPLTYGHRQFGDVKMHDEDAEKNVNLIVNKIVNRFFKNQVYISINKVILKTQRPA